MRANRPGEVRRGVAAPAPEPGPRAQGRRPAAHGDVAIVGGGIAGSALAVVLARAGLQVVVLERQRRYADLVRGENLHPWGVAETQRLGLYDTLQDVGGHLVDRIVDYEHGQDPRVAEAQALPLDRLLDGVPGELNLSHPAACEALATAATSAGATVLCGVDHVGVVPGTRPRVTYRADGALRELRPRLVVGADGRSSRVRRQIGVTLDRAPGTHMVAGVLVDGLAIDPRHNVVAVGDDAWMATFPQGGGRARVYLCWSTEHPRRYTGPAGLQRLLTASCFDVVPGGRAWADASPVGHCRTFPADETWTDRPFTEGVALIGDAAGFTDPLIGQGLALALRDVRALTESLLGSRRWDQAALARYGSERAERLRRARFLGQLHATVWTTFGPAGPDLRQDVRERMRHDRAMQAGLLGIFTGPEHLDPQVFTEAYRRHYLGLDRPARSPRPRSVAAVL